MYSEMCIHVSWAAATESASVPIPLAPVYSAQKGVAATTGPSVGGLVGAGVVGTGISVGAEPVVGDEVSTGVGVGGIGASTGGDVGIGAVGVGGFGTGAVGVGGTTVGATGVGGSGDGEVGTAGDGDGDGWLFLPFFEPLPLFLLDLEVYVVVGSSVSSLVGAGVGEEVGVAVGGRTVGDDVGLGDGAHVGLGTTDDLLELLLVFLLDPLPFPPFSLGIFVVGVEVGTGVVGAAVGGGDGVEVGIGGFR
ncbi:hypothetical protein FisN_4Lh137 [Fistulifera solaris]|uniref:Uncharacterized protein n=1 Tax=Fistulifera solaris TaxID=1519565 RepID=A0A1Z5JZK8_FISSO|nr:hypothetical protein FisN_4Lh137 [Fistulifera solaris]|eukprot:GAX19286.1 hypothetical protein FisN_4Lh137 [Fistulifera solaris]